jgi:hypothetical protein
VVRLIKATAYGASFPLLICAGAVLFGLIVLVILLSGCYGYLKPLGERRL